MTDAIMIHTLWQHFLTLGSLYGHRYGISPVLFGALYLAHHPLFWGTMAWLAARVRQRRPVGGVIALGIFFWLMPYAYIFVFGRHLPGWTYAVAMLVLTVGGRHAFLEIRRRLVKT